MRYENPELPEGTNNSDRRPFVNFLKLAGAALGLVVALAALLILLAEQLTPLVPFRYEQAVVRTVLSPAAASGPVEPYLKALAARLARAQGLPEGISIDVRYDPAETVNAFATLGGHIVLYQGLLEAVPDENALAMVVAHEIAHVRHRHPIGSLGRAAALSFALMVAGADSGGGQAIQTAVAQGGSLTMLSFSRSQEAQADATALETIERAYGHTAGADAFFRLMLGRAGQREPPRFLASHPLTAARLEALSALAAKRGWKTDGPITPIPAEVRAEVERHKAKAPPGSR